MAMIELDGGSCMIQLAGGPLPGAQSYAVSQEVVLGDPDSRVMGGSCIDLVASMPVSMPAPGCKSCWHRF